MAYGNANLDSDYVAWAAADMPLLIGRNWLKYSGASARWTGGTWTTDQSDADGPAYYGYDDHDHLQTYPTGVGYVNYVINFGAAIAAVDSVIVLNHNTGTLGATAYVDFDENQDGLFSSVHRAASQTPSDDKRLVFLDLDHGSVGTPQVYSDVQYMRLQIYGGGSVVELGEVIIGQRRQLKAHPKLPYQSLKFDSNKRKTVSDSGVDQSYVFWKGRRRISGRFLIHEDARQSDVESFFNDETEYGTRPFVYVDNPNSSPSDAYWMEYDEAVKDNSLLGFSEREFSIIATEKGPNFLSAGV